MHYQQLKSSKYNYFITRGKSCGFKLSTGSQPVKTKKTFPGLREGFKTNLT